MWDGVEHAIVGTSDRPWKGVTQILLVSREPHDSFVPHKASEIQTRGCSRAKAAIRTPPLKGAPICGKTQR